MTSKESRSSNERMPAIFMAHGSPITLDDQVWMSEWYDWAQQIPKPESILMISAHWEANPISINATEPVPLYYDFYGFPQKYYQVKYSSPGAPKLAERVKKLLGAKNEIVQDKKRGLDHGAYIPLIAMYPKADIPVLQLSLPTMDPEELLKLGNSLEPLRNENVLIIGSGFITHNMRYLDFQSQKPASWARDFDIWVKEALVNRDIDKLLAYKEKAPNVHTALPTHEHFVPLLVAQGTNLNESESVSFPIEGYAYGNFTKRSVQFE